MINRRAFLKRMTALVPAGILPTAQTGYKHESFSSLSKALEGRDYFKELKIEKFINAAGTSSSLGGSLIWREVVEAMNYASTRRARMKELHDAVGMKIASMIGCEAAMISAGATSSLTLGTAACITGINKEAIKQIPDLTGKKNEVIIQKSHRYSYDHAIRNCGVRLMEVETSDDLKRSINQKTAMMLFVYARAPRGQIELKEFAVLGKKYKIPTLIDGATTVPPVENLSGLLNLGYDLAAFSGGKGLRGPFSAGLLLGRKDLIEAARLNSSPNDDTIGRGMKISKEELLGMMVAIEVSMKHDLSAERKEKAKWIRHIVDQVASIPGIKAEMFLPEITDRLPSLRLDWDESVMNITRAELKQQLKEGEPSIEVHSFPYTRGEFQLSSSMLLPGEAEMIARRICEIFRQAS